MSRRLTPAEAAAALVAAIPIDERRPPRRVRTTIEGVDLHGDRERLCVTSPTLVVFVSTTCDGCVELVGLVRTHDLPLGVVGALRAPASGLPDAGITRFTGTSGRWVLGDEAFEAFEVSSAPYFCLVDGEGTVIVEGVALGRAHVEDHVRRALEGRPRPDSVRLRPGET
jgi:hypothetical protein